MSLVKTSSLKIAAFIGSSSISSYGHLHFLEKEKIQLFFLQNKNSKEVVETDDYFSTDKKEIHLQVNIISENEPENIEANLIKILHYN